MQSVPTRALEQLFVSCMALDDVTRPSLLSAELGRGAESTYQRLCEEGRRYDRDFRGSLFAAIGHDVGAVLVTSASLIESESAASNEPALEAVRGEHQESLQRVPLLFLEFAVALAVLVDSSSQPALRVNSADEVDAEHLAAWLDAAVRRIDYSRYRRARAFWRDCVTQLTADLRLPPSETLSRYDEFAPVDGKALRKTLRPPATFQPIVQEAARVAASARRLVQRHSEEEAAATERMQGAWERVDREVARVERRIVSEETATQQFHDDYLRTVKDEERSVLERRAQERAEEAGERSRSAGGARGAIGARDAARALGAAQGLMDVACSVRDEFEEEALQEIGTVILEEVAGALAEKALLLVAPKLMLGIRLARFMARALGGC